MKKEEVLEFIKSKKHTVISTTDGNKVESALMGFGQTDDFEIIIGTSNKSKKYKNLKTNNNVSFVFGLGEEKQTVQYEGLASELSGDEKEKYTAVYFAKAPFAEKYKDLPDQSYWVIRPKWIKFTDVSTNPPIVEEFNF